MLKCWKIKPHNRPSFEKIAESIGEILEELESTVETPMKECATHGPVEHIE